MPLWPVNGRQDRGKFQVQTNRVIARSKDTCVSRGWRNQGWCWVSSSEAEGNRHIVMVLLWRGRILKQGRTAI